MGKGEYGDIWAIIAAIVYLMVSPFIFMWQIIKAVLEWSKEKAKP
jgi:hypothetical protein